MTVRCDECGRRLRSPDGWNAMVRRGVIVGYLCPSCQTPEQNAEAEINEATVDYRYDHLGRLTGRPKDRSSP